MFISIIAAISQNRVIGNQNTLPWHLPSDLKNFKYITRGQPIIMGRKTWESIGRPLPGRINIIISRDPEFAAEHPTEIIEIANSLEDAIYRAKTYGAPEIFIIGGAQIYKAALDQHLVNKIYLTDIDAEPEGDTYFPILDPKAWDITQEGQWQQNPGDQYRHRFLVLERPSNNA